LDFAINRGLGSGGWCPKGRLAEDGIIPAKYPLSESDSAEYHVRTYLNVESSDATLILFTGSMDEGSRLTGDIARKLGKPLLLIDLHKESGHGSAREWLSKGHYQTLNIAGPRESHSPGIYQQGLSFLEKLFA
jgi:hypothetical protein